MPLPLKLVVAFFLVSAARHLIQAGSWLFANEDPLTMRLLAAELFPDLLLFSLELLLATLLFLRNGSSRLLALVYTGTVLALTGFVLVDFGLDRAERLITLSTMAIYAVIIGYLVSRRGREHLFGT